MTDNHKEHRVTETPTVDELEAKIAAERQPEGDYTYTDAATGKEVSREEVMAALPEGDEPSGYDIQPAADPDEDEDEGPDPEPNAITAFLVITTTDGASFATSDIAKIKEILPQREATIADMRRGCQEVVHDVNAMQTAQQTVGLMQQQAQMMAEEQRNAKIAAKLASKGIHVPQGGRRG